ncbi:MAG: energy transducer TonB [Marinilabiliaceae bacterium]|nr:energy transducer TonB [Marinilabiliaceae bacterium]
MNRLAFLLLLIFLLCNHISFASNEEVIQLKFNPSPNKTYTYSSIIYVNDLHTLSSTVEHVFTKKSDDNYIRDTRITEMNIAKDNSVIFSLNSILSNSEMDFPMYQKLLKDIQINTHINDSGVLVKEFDADIWFESNGYNPNKIDNGFKEIMTDMTINEFYFFINTELSAGKKVVYQSKKNQSYQEYMVLDINDKYVVFASLSPSSTNKDYNMVIIMERESGLPLYSCYTNYSDNSNITVCMLYARDDFIFMDPAIFPAIIPGFESKPWEVNFTESPNLPSKFDAKKSIAEHEIDASLISNNGLYSFTLLNKQNDNIKIKIEEVSAISKENSKHILLNNKTKYPILNSYYNNMTFFPNIFIGDTNVVDKALTKVDVTAFYGNKKVELNKNMIGTKINLTKGDLILFSWEDDNVILSDAKFIAYSKNNEPINHAHKSLYWPQYKLIADWLNIPQKEVTPNMVLLFSPLFPDYLDLKFFKYSFDEPINSITVYDAENFIVENKILQAVKTNDDNFITEEELTIEINEEKEEEVDNVYYIVEEMPSFPGGDNKMYSFINNSIQYPQYAIDNNIEGKVFVQFIIEKDGSLSSFNIIKGVHESIDNEAIRIIKSMPKWIPGKQRGKETRIYYTVSINFKLNQLNK